MSVLSSSITRLSLHFERMEELRGAKQKLTRSLKEKDDELEKANTKVESYDKTLSVLDALRKEVCSNNIMHQVLNV